MGNGTANSGSSPDRVRFGLHTNSHLDMFSKLEETLLSPGTAPNKVISWASGALSYCDDGIPTLLHSHLLPPPSTMSKWIASGNLNSKRRSYVPSTVELW